MAVNGHPDSAARRVLVTGTSGFVGSHLVPVLRTAGFEVTATGGAKASALGPGVGDDRLRRALEGFDAVIHLAAVAHRRADVEELQQINAHWPVRLFQAAVAAGVADFVFLSSLKVLGDVSEAPLAESDAYRPADAYARSKMQAELDLQAAAAASTARLAIVRPPLVYGPGVKANFLALLRLAEWGARGIPLPLGAAAAPRSLIGVRNLCSLLRCAVGEVGIIHGADAQDLTVASLLQRLGVTRLIRVPAPLLKPPLAWTGFAPVYERLFLPLQIDQRRSRKRIGWAAPFSVEEQLEETLAWFRSR